MKEIYPNVKKDARINGGTYKLNDELRGIFDRMFMEDSDPVKAKRLEIQQLNTQLEALGETPTVDPIPSQNTEPEVAAGETPESARAEILSGVSDATDGGEPGIESLGLLDENNQGSERPAGEGKGTATGETSNAVERARIQSELRVRRNELQQLQLSAFTPGEPSAAAKRASEANFLPGALGTENLRESGFRRAISSIITPLKRLADMTAGLREFPGGAEFIKRADNVDAYRNMQRGLFEEPLKKAYAALSKKDISWLMDFKYDENGNAWPNIVKLLDPAGSPEPTEAPTPAIKALQDLHSSINDQATKEQIKWGVLRKLRNDATVVAQRSKIERMPRMVSEAAYHAMLQGSGRLYNSIVDHLYAANLDSNPNLKRIDVDKDIQRYYGRNSTRRLGQLEYSRLIKYAPSVINFDGSDFTLFHFEPYRTLSTSVDRQFGRIGFVREFGQGVVKDVGNAVLKRVLKVFGAAPTPITKEHVLDQLDAKGYLSPGMEKLSMKALVDIARRQPDITLGDSRDTLIAKVLELSPAGLYENLQFGAKNKAMARARYKGLRSLAVELKGVDPGMEPSALLAAVKQRAQEHVQDRLYDTLRNSFGKQGGNLDHFDAAMQLLQGMPYKPLPRTPYTQALRFVSHIVGALQTSTSAAPNVAQTASLVPAFAGAANYFEALRSYMANPEQSVSTIAGLGALKYDVLARTQEPGYAADAWGRWLQQGLAKITGLSQLDIQNNAVAGGSFRLMAESWNKNGVGKSDLGTVKLLRLTDQEVLQMNKGQMDRALLSKIVQNGVNATQFRGEGSWRKGITENSPIARILFAYSSYTNGMARTAGALMREWSSLAQSKDPIQAFGTLKRTVAVLAGTAGAGMASIILRQALKGQFTQQVGKVDQTTLEKAGAGLYEAGVFGATQRFLEPFSADKGVFERGMIGLMPQVTAVGRLMAAVMGGYGKFGRFGPVTRIWEAAKEDTPGLRGASNWFESQAWPDKAQYDSAMATMRKYKEQVAPEQLADIGEHELNPDYYPSALALARNDQQELVEKAQEFYARIPRIIQNKPELGTSVQTVMQGYRASLVQRAPLNLQDLGQLQFLAKLSPTRREQLLELHQRYMAMVDLVAPRQSQD